MNVKTLEPAHSLFFAPRSLKSARNADEAVIAFVRQVLNGELNDRQSDAIRQSFSKRLSLLWGPPGTGKTATLSALMTTWAETARRLGRPIRIGVGASNYNAIDNVLESFAQLVAKRNEGACDPLLVSVIRLRSDSAAPRDITGVEDVARSAADHVPNELEGNEGLWIVGGTQTQLLKMTTGARKAEIGAPWFDLLVLDEASQLTSAAALGYFCLLRPHGHVVVCGDDMQLGPVYQYKIEDSRSGLLDCAFTYFRVAQDVEPVSLAMNYRCNQAISGWPSARFYGNDFESHHKMRHLSLAPVGTCNGEEGWPPSLAWSPVYDEILDPDIALTVVAYEDKSCTVSNGFEAQLAVALMYRYAQRLAGPGVAIPTDFWREHAAIVTPHRAQIATIRNLIGPDLGCADEGLSFVDTVDRFQGQERNLIVASYTASDPDFIASEEEFILDSRRFNVTLTRARMKFVLLISRSLLRHLPSDDKMARSAAHLQLFPASYCGLGNEVEVPYLDTSGAVRNRLCQLFVKGV